MPVNIGGNVKKVYLNDSDIFSRGVLYKYITIEFVSFHYIWLYTTIQTILYNVKAHFLISFSRCWKIYQNSFIGQFSCNWRNTWRVRDSNNWSCVGFVCNTVCALVNMLGSVAFNEYVISKMFTFIIW